MSLVGLLAAVDDGLVRAGEGKDEEYLYVLSQATVLDSIKHPASKTPRTEWPGVQVCRARQLYQWPRQTSVPVVPLNMKVSLEVRILRI